MSKKHISGTADKVLRSALAAATALAFTPALAIASSAPATSPASTASGTSPSDPWEVGPKDTKKDVIAWLDSGNVLHIECAQGVTSSAMYDFSEGDMPDWYDQRDDIVAVEIGDGVTSIGDYALGGLTYEDGTHDEYTALTRVDGGNALTSIGDNAFDFATASTLYDFTDCTLTSVGSGWLGSKNQSLYSNGIVYVKDKASAELAESNAGNAGKQRHAIAVTTGGALSSSATYSSTTLAGLNNTTALERTGYTFNNWYTDEAYSQTYSGSWATGGTDRANDGLVVYARWNPNAGSAVDKPVAVDGLTYTGSAQTGVVAGTGYTLSGDATGTNAGSYTATVSLADGYTAWSDNSTASYNLTWSIAKATPTLTVSKATVELEPRDQGDVTVNYGGDGSLSVATSDDSVAEATVSGTVVTVDAVDEGTATITVSASATANCNAASTSFTVIVEDAVADYTQANGYEPYQGWQNTAWAQANEIDPYYSSTPGGTTRAGYPSWTLFSPLSKGVTGYDTTTSSYTTGTGDVEIVTDTNACIDSATPSPDTPNYFKNVILDPLDASGSTLSFDMMVLAAGGANTNSSTFTSIAGGGFSITTTADPSTWYNADGTTTSSVVWTADTSTTTTGATTANWCRWVKVAAPTDVLAPGETYYFVIKNKTTAGHTHLFANIVFEFTVTKSSGDAVSKTWSGDLTKAGAVFDQGVNGGTKFGLLAGQRLGKVTTDLTKTGYWHNTLTDALTATDGVGRITLRADGSGSNWQTVATWASQGIAVYDKALTTISDTGAVSTTETATHSIAYSSNGSDSANVMLGYYGVDLDISNLESGHTYYLVVPSTFSASSSPVLGKVIVYEFTVA